MYQQTFFFQNFPTQPPLRKLSGSAPEIGLQSLVTRFEEERIDGNVALTLSDGELKRLGIDTIGDKYRLVPPLPK